MQAYKGSFTCSSCNSNFQATYISEKPNICPDCGAKTVKCISETKDMSFDTSSGGCGCGCGSH
jgi:rRNA maturation endonuclease Nob1